MCLRDRSWPMSRLAETTRDKRAGIGVGGACAEVLSYGNAERGVADLIQRRRIYGAAASASRSSNVDGVDGQPDALGSFTDDAKDRRLRREKKQSDGTMDEKEMDNRTRFALGFSMGLLRQPLGALEELELAP